MREISNINFVRIVIEIDWKNTPVRKSERVKKKSTRYFQPFLEKKVMEKEMVCVQKNNTNKVVEKPKDKKILDTIKSDKL